MSRNQSEGRGFTSAKYNLMLPRGLLRVKSIHSDGSTVLSIENRAFREHCDGSEMALALLGHVLRSQDFTHVQQLLAIYHVLFSRQRPKTTMTSMRCSEGYATGTHRLSDSISATGLALVKAQPLKCNHHRDDRAPDDDPYLMIAEGSAYLASQRTNRQVTDSAQYSARLYLAAWHLTWHGRMRAVEMHLA